jgi:hypothetical protein
MVNVLGIQSKAITRRVAFSTWNHVDTQKSITRNVQIAVRNNYINWTEEQRTYL